MKLLFACCSLALLSLTAFPGGSPAWSPQEEDATSTAEEIPAELDWPRVIPIEAGTVNLYQPQPEGFEGDTLTARAVVSVILESKEEPVFGTVWIEAMVETDRSERIVYLRSVKVPKVRFPDTTVQEEAALSALLEKEIASWEVELSLDRLLTSLDAAEKEMVAAEGLATAPPRIVFTKKSTVLVLVDGDPQLTLVENTSLMRVANTAFLMIFDGSRKKYYLYGAEKKWFESSEVNGPWKLSTDVPADVAKLEPEPPAPDPEEAEDAELEDAGVVPEVLVSTEPTELLQTKGDPTFSPTADNELMFVSNTDSTILLEVSTQSYYVLLAGRWYRSRSLEKGPWEYVASDALPASFQSIPVDSDVGDARAFIGGTVEAQDAILDAQIPQTASVDRKTATITVEYDGEPKFTPIEGTELQYAVNTSTPVLQASGKFYACVDGAWYVAVTPNGPWAVATERPAGVEEIPATCPVYNVKYVYVYHVTPTVVYVGYTPAYMGCYVYNGCIVYGTGYYYPGWYGRYYYGRPCTWGLGVRWNPWTGWSFGLTVSNGFFTFGIGFHRWGRWHGGWWGPARYHGYRRGYHRGYHNGFRHGYRAGFAAGMRRSNIYHNNRRPGVSSPRPRPRTNPGVAGGTRPGARPGTSPGTRPGTSPGTRPSTQPATRPGSGPSAGRGNNLYADRAGNVHSRDQSGNWNQVSKDRPGTGGATTRPTTKPATRPTQSTTQRNLNQSASARQRGTQRTSSYNSSRSRSSGGASRGRSGGGGRRR